MIANTTPTPDSGKFTIRYNILFAGFVILAALLIIVFIVDKATHQDIKLTDYISMASLGSVTIGLIYTAISFQYTYKADMEKSVKDEDRYRQALESAKAHEKLTKIKFTYDICSTWYKSDMALNVQIARKFMQPFKDKLHDSNKLEDFINTLDTSDNDRKAFVAVLNYFESISLLIKDEIIDEDTAKKSFKTVFSAYYTNLKIYIKRIQEIDHGVNHRVYCNFVEIAEKWQKS